LLLEAGILKTNQHKPKENEMSKLEEYEKKVRAEKQSTCKHKYLIGKSDGKYECCDCDKELNKLPEHRTLMF
jgi:hypothetical protein